MARCLLALGSNLGNRAELLRSAMGEVSRLPESQLLARSRWRETPSIGGPEGQDPFLNGALLIQTSLAPLDLMARLQEIETRLGRQRTVRWGARAIDIDWLLCDAQVLASPALQLPHPRMSFRRFVLEPAVEIAGSMLHPTSGWTLAQLLFHLKSAARYVAVAAPEPRLADWLADRLASTLGCLRLEPSLAEPSAATDSEPPNTVEFHRWATSMLNRRRWQQHAQLALRLPTARVGLGRQVTPVVSSFWLPRASVSPAELPLRPALVLALESAAPQKLPSAQHGSPKIGRKRFRQLLDQAGHGPLARIQAENPAEILDEAVAAVRAAWPELRCRSTELPEEE